MHKGLCRQLVLRLHHKCRLSCLACHLVQPLVLQLIVVVGRLQILANSVVQHIHLQCLVHRRGQRNSVP